MRNDETPNDKSIVKSECRKPMPQLYSSENPVSDFGIRASFVMGCRVRRESPIGLLMNLRPTTP